MKLAKKVNVGGNISSPSLMNGGSIETRLKNFFIKSKSKTLFSSSDMASSSTWFTNELSGWGFWLFLDEAAWPLLFSCSFVSFASTYTELYFHNCWAANMTKRGLKKKYIAKVANLIHKNLVLINYNSHASWFLFSTHIWWPQTKITWPLGGRPPSRYLFGRRNLSLQPAEELPEPLQCKP